MAGGEPAGYLHLNLGLPGANPASGLSRTWTRELRIASPALYPLGHAASLRERYHDSVHDCHIAWVLHG